MGRVVQDGWEKKKSDRTIVVTLDCKRAYDRVWKVRMNERMMDESVPGKIARWYASFFRRNNGRVRVGNEMSNWKKMQEGLPQGEVSSPILFLLYANYWKNSMVQDVGYSGFADDHAILSSGPCVESVKNKIQRALDKVDSWAKQNKIGLNPSNSECCVFTRRMDERKWNPILNVGERKIH